MSIQKRISKVKKSSIIFVLILAILLLLTCACSIFDIEYTGEKGEINEKILDYIEKKYNFSPKVTSIKEDTNYRRCFYS